MMNSFGTDQFWSLYRALPKDVRKLAQKNYMLWRTDPKHPSLHYKTISSNRPVYSVRLGDNYRVIGLLRDGTMFWFWIGSHTEYDLEIRKYR